MESGHMILIASLNIRSGQAAGRGGLKSALKALQQGNISIGFL